MSEQKYCPQCGKENLPSTVFCKSCGSPLGSSAPTPPPGPPVPAPSPNSGGSRFKVLVSIALVGLLLVILAGYWFLVRPGLAQPDINQAASESGIAAVEQDLESSPAEESEDEQDETARTAVTPRPTITSLPDETTTDTLIAGTEPDPESSPAEESEDEQDEAARTVVTPRPTITSLPTETAVPPTQTLQPTYTPLPTNTPFPTHTPIPTATTAPTSAPTNTPRPAATSTPVPVACSVGAAGPFVGRWDEDGIGCALGGANAVWMAEEAFERGRMFWRSDNDRIYAVYSNGAWGSYADLWREGDPAFSCGTESSPPTPQRGFGKIWCTYANVKDGLGNATSAESGADAIIQVFERGFMFQSASGNINTFYENGTWR